MSELSKIHVKLSTLSLVENVSSDNKCAMFYY